MGLKSKEILYKLDFIGFTPQFRILNESRYKSIFSSILSILIIIFAVVFISYSFADFVHQNPNVDYYKCNDQTTNKTYEISNSLFMFNYLYICWSNITDESELRISSYDATNFIFQYYEVEPCELGKNIDLKYKGLIEEFDKVEDSYKSKDYLCINFNKSDFTLYSNPFLPQEKENELSLKINADCEDYLLVFTMVTQNDYIDHNKKDNPIVPHYKKNTFSLNNEKLFTVYNYQYIKYETDNGIIFTNKTIINGIGEASPNQFDKRDISDSILSITFKMNSSNYDYYKRAFIKFQSFLADVMSLINLLITISKVISEFLLYKKMHKDIIRYIITSNDKAITKRKKDLFYNNKLFNHTFEIKEKISNKMLEKRIKENKIVEEINSNVDFNEQNKDNLKEIENTNDKIINVMKDLNFINILKSFFCFKERKLKLINLCNQIINQDICIERILKRLYILEKDFNTIMDNNNKSSINSDLSRVKRIINKINGEFIQKTINKEENNFNDK